MELTGLEVRSVLRERSSLQGHAPAPRAHWAELQEPVSESRSSPELVGNSHQEAFAAPGVKSKLSCPHLEMFPSEQVIQHLYRLEVNQMPHSLPHFRSRCEKAMNCTVDPLVPLH